MNFIEVIPLTRGIPKETLSYYTAQDVATGNLVSVPVRHRETHAIVTDVEDVADAKARIRALDYQVKKLTALKARSFLAVPFIAAAASAADYFATTTGSVIASLVPKVILEEASKLVPAPRSAPHEGAIREISILQSDDEERFAAYRGLIREAFAREKSLFFVVPTIHDLWRLASQLHKGVEKYLYLLHSSLPQKELAATWRAILKERHPVVIIGTGSFLSLPRPDIGTVIIEHEISPAYSMQKRPFLDTRVFAEFLTRETGARLVLGGTLIRTETFVRYEKNEVAELAPPKFRPLSEAESHIIDMRSLRKDEDSDRVLLSPELEELTRYIQKDGGRLFLFTARRGLAPITLCGDCASPVLCAHCSTPVTLKRSDGDETEFLCHTCGTVRSADELCRACGSWKLVPLGLGSDRVRETFTRRFPKLNVFTLTKESAPTYRKGASIMKKFLGTPGSVLVGTERALYYLNDRVEYAGVVSLDAFLAIPHFRVGERIMEMLVTLRSRTRKALILQTRAPDDRLLNHALQGNVLNFYREEVRYREKFGYPPYTTLIKISLEGRREAVTKEMAFVTELLKEYEPSVFPAFVEISRGKFRLNALLKIPRGAWPDKTLLQKLRALPPAFAVSVNPESIL